MYEERDSYQFCSPSSGAVQGCPVRFEHAHPLAECVGLG